MAQNLAQGSKEGDNAQRTATVFRQGFGLTQPHPKHGQAGKGDIGKEDRVPAAKRHDARPHQRGHGGNDGEDHHHEAHDPGHVTAREQVADHGDGNCTRGGGTKTLQDAGDQKHLKRGGEIAGKGGQRIEARPDQDRPFAPEGI